MLAVGESQQGSARAVFALQAEHHPPELHESVAFFTQLLARHPLSCFVSSDRFYILSYPVSEEEIPTLSKNASLLEAGAFADVWIHDVVVDASARGQGLGRQLVVAAVEGALREIEQAGCTPNRIRLVSLPQKVGYWKRLGFIEKALAEAGLPACYPQGSVHMELGLREFAEANPSRSHPTRSHPI
jgi:GNAT superfamily N-acetyltransferase